VPYLTRCTAGMVPRTVSKNCARLIGPTPRLNYRLDRSRRRGCALGALDVLGECGLPIGLGRTRLHHPGHGVRVARFNFTDHIAELSHRTIISVTVDSKPAYQWSLPSITCVVDGPAARRANSSIG
jgi:hypothetical protein